MPRQVDHDARRREVAEVAARLISQVGVERVTVRELAKAAGYSTAIVSHYFADKRQLLLFTYQAAAQAAQARVDAVLEHAPDDLIGTIEALLPLDEARHREWQVWLSFWGMAIGDPEFAAEQRGRAFNTRKRIEKVLRTMADNGKLAKDTDFDLIARELLTMVNGLAVQAGFDPADWPPESLRKVLLQAVKPLTAKA
ncbi:TetR/AcrR family transcriptional regulator [Emcibacter sp. SYSU 3D8]|uniref:TetR/AcrR family transcriptional regulator n=1 Tax=Emcibacter sp. SYSU 3D8 TaxID=3133969 RepID=UPI0031FEA74D